jgi:hypothetical protein
MRIDFDLIAPSPQHVQRRIAYVAGGKNSERLI